MGPRLRGAIWEAFKVSAAVAVFVFLQDQIIQVRRDLHGSANGIAEAQCRYSRELNETRGLIRSALEDTSLKFARAQRIIEESTERIHGERRELAQLIDDRTGALATTLKERIESERNLIEGARTTSERDSALLRKLERALDQDLLRMKRSMVYPTVQLRGSGTVGSGVIVYSRPQGEGDPEGPAVTLILTAHHVVMEVMGTRANDRVVEEVRILGESDGFEADPVAADLLIFDRDRDTALLRLRSARRFPHVAELASRETLSKLNVFTRAYAVGCPLGNRPLPTVGEISSKSKVVGDQVFWMLSAPTFFGNSGGGVYTASSCQLIGISSMIYTYGREAPTVVPHLGLFVPLESIAGWLEGEGYSFILGRAPVPADLIARWEQGPSRE